MVDRMRADVVRVRLNVYVEKLPSMLTTEVHSHALMKSLCDHRDLL